MAQELGTGYVTIMPSTKGLQQNIQSSLNDAFDGALSKGESKFRSFFGTVAAAGAAVLAAVGIGKLVKSTISAGVQFNALEQSSRAAFTTILGSGAAASDMMTKLDAFAQISPFDKAIFIQGTQQLLGFGVAADRVIPTLQAVQDAVAAVGGSSQDISQVTYALAQIKGQGKLTGETLNQLGQYGIDAASIIAQKMGKTSQQIRDMASQPGGIPADKVFDLLVNGLEEKFAGAAANVKGTWSGVVQSIGARIRNIGSDLVEPFVSKQGGGYATVWLGKFADSLSTLRSSTAFSSLTAALGSFAAKLDPIVNATLTKLQSLLERVGRVDFGRLASKVKTFLPLILPVLGGLAAVFSHFAASLPFIGKFLPTISGPIGIIAGLLAALLITSPGFRDALAGAFHTIADAAGAIAEVLGPVIGQVTSFLSEHKEILIGVVAAWVGYKVVLAGISFVKLIAGLTTSAIAWGKQTVAMLASKSETIALMAMYARDFVVNLARATAAVAKDTAVWIAANAPKLVARLGMLAYSAALGIAAAAQWILNAAMDANPIGLIILAVIALIAIIVLLVANWDTVVKFLTDVWNGFVSWFTGVMDAFLGWWNGIWTSFAGFVTGVWNGFIGWIVGVWNGFVSLLMATGNNVGRWWNGLWSGIISFFTGVWSNIQRVIGTVGSAFSKAFGGLGNIVRGAFSGVVSFVKGVINSIIDVVNGAIGGINDIAAGVKTITGGAINIRLGKIPHLKDSGTVRARPGGTLALLAEGGRDESVVDTGKLNDLIDSASRGTGGSTDQFIGIRPGDRVVFEIEGTPLTAVAKRVMRSVIPSAVAVTSEFAR